MPIPGIFFSLDPLGSAVWFRFLKRWREAGEKIPAAPCLFGRGGDKRGKGAVSN